MEVMDSTGIAFECDTMLDSLQRELQSIRVSVDNWIYQLLLQD